MVITNVIETQVPRFGKFLLLVESAALTYSMVLDGAGHDPCGGARRP